ncbi:metal-dependent hydrolase [Haloglomus litoreum]|uniref:metal-dependent hydrolase n=1 Tax=Haloglomus litoreum TaxID=3034026 RepID=UPI0023E8EBE4|nr:metal-dependent hydrolase [Haloglomus sp. DT116]
MWPWGHLAVAYVCYSVGRRVRRRPPPADLPVAALAFGALTPDLIDKPLSWGLGLFPTGYALGHSVFVALPVGIAVLLDGYRRGRAELAAAFVVGYWSHLLGDVGSGLLFGDGLSVSTVLWPVVQREPYGESLGLFGRSWHYLREFGGSLAATDRPAMLLLGAAVPVALALALWLLDGAPGPGVVRRRWPR